MRFLAVIGFIVLGSLGSVMAQSYVTALGLRLGNSNYYRTAGLSIQQRIGKNLTIEGIFQSDFGHNTTFHALFQGHHGLLTKRLNLYAGAGFSAGTEESRIDDTATGEIITTFGNATMGADLVVGAEITLLKYNISIDYKPNFNVVGREPWYNGQVGISARAVIIKGKDQKKRQRKRARSKRQKEKEKEKGRNEKEKDK
ncbi:MAG: hypothetical protein OEX02_10050 [Cyclobacteriaceae bacterium]|nr:hypothetical protein [Cyclobacteriaceae bacterium]